MAKVRSFTVLPSLPESLKGLEVIAKNLFWTWNPDYIDLFKRVDNALWEKCGHNPVKLLGSVSQERLEELGRNEGFVYQINSAVEKLNDAMNSPKWFDHMCRDSEKPQIAYFSAEFGIHEAMPIYSGGLGILAGDHLKSASDLGVSLTGVGLMYQDGYFRQYLNADGWQQERYVENDFHNMPVELVTKPKSKRPLTVSVQFPHRTVHAQVWKAQVGTVTLYLLDTNIPANRPNDREITSALYGGDNEMRICQEMILGIGGYKALLAIGLEPKVCHMNEGHAAFMALERIREMRNKFGMTFDEAVDATRCGNVFTVHTPVAAGCDSFPVELMDKYFANYFPKLGINRQQFLLLGRFGNDDDAEQFKMPVLAIKLSSYRNGVSKLHGEVSREMWKDLWSEVQLDEVPIDSVTNGIHAQTWVSPELNSLYELYLGSNWNEDVFNTQMWDHIDQVPDEELWRIHQRCKEKLIGYARKRFKMQLSRRGAANIELARAEEVLDPEALTIGFARRFATYKRGNLLLRDVERLMKLLEDQDRPIQFIFAGKAHPRDDQGKEIIKKIVHFARDEKARRRIIFLEDYDIDVARYLVQGVDVWLNNPRRPLEASGTSGMKAAINGVLNLSTDDGWWCEGYGQDRGWVIGAGETYDDVEYGDKVESEALYNIIENELIPLFYSRSKEKLPRGWIRWMKNCIKFCAPAFSTHRMVAEYAEKFYLPSAAKYSYINENEMGRAKALTAWKNEIRNCWEDVNIIDVDMAAEGGKKTAQLKALSPELYVGAELQISAEVRLGRVKSDDVSVEAYFGTVDGKGNVRKGGISYLELKGDVSDEGVAIFTGKIPCDVSGQHGFSVRVLPNHPDLGNPIDMGLIKWENH